MSDRKVVVSDESLYTCWVGSNFEEEGRKAGEWLANYLETRGRSRETINLATLQGTLDSSAQLGRTEGFSEVLALHKNWNMLEYQSADFTQTKAQGVMERFLAKYPDIDVVICENDNMAFGAIDAIHEAGKTLWHLMETSLSFRSMRSGQLLKLCREGKINMMVECNPLQGCGGGYHSAAGAW